MEVVPGMLPARDTRVKAEVDEGGRAREAGDALAGGLAGRGRSLWLTGSGRPAGSFLALAEVRLSPLG